MDGKLLGIFEGSVEYLGDSTMAISGGGTMATGTDGLLVEGMEGIEGIEGIEGHSSY